LPRQHAFVVFGGLKKHRNSIKSEFEKNTKNDVKNGIKSRFFPTFSLNLEIIAS
jgi:hypothetical protein